MRRKPRSPEEVELNLAAMLDMAFQLLAFFVLTYHFPGQEGEVDMRLPKLRPVADSRDPPTTIGRTPSTTPPGVNTLVISAFADAQGRLTSLGLGQTRIGSLAELDGRLQTVLGDRASPFDQVVIQISPDLCYGELMKIIDVCTRQALPGGGKLTKLSFADLPG
jgi:biopolymer transport protein ExbD